MRQSGSKEGRSRVEVSWESSQARVRTRGKRQQRLAESSILSMRESWRGWSQRGSKCVWCCFFLVLIGIFCESFRSGLGNYEYYCILYTKPKFRKCDYAYVTNNVCLVVVVRVMCMMISYYLLHRSPITKGKIPVETFS